MVNITMNAEQPPPPPAVLPTPPLETCYAARAHIFDALTHPAAASMPALTAPSVTNTSLTQPNDVNTAASSIAAVPATNASITTRPRTQLSRSQQAHRELQLQLRTIGVLTSVTILTTAISVLWLSRKLYSCIAAKKQAAVRQPQPADDVNEHTTLATRIHRRLQNTHNTHPAIVDSSSILSSEQQRRQSAAFTEFCRHAKELEQTQNIYIADPRALFDSIQNIRRESLSKLLVVSHFDGTLTDELNNPNTPLNSSSLLQASYYLPAQYVLDVQTINSNYSFLDDEEKSASLTYEQRLKYITEWQNKLNTLLIHHGTQRHYVTEAAAHVVQYGLLQLREGTKQLLQQLHSNNVPLALFNDDCITDTIEKVLENCAAMHPNIDVYGQRMVYTSSGQLTGFKDQSLNTITADNSQYTERTNLIVIGDQLHHSKIVDTPLFSDCNNVITIGLLTDSSGGSIKAYQQVYDIVIAKQDADLSFVQELLTAVGCNNM